MAARRLIAVMLVLLFLSSLAAALAPPVEDREEGSPTPTTSEPAPARADDAEVLRERLDAGAKRKRTIAATVGDQLQLRVSGERVATVEIGGVGAGEDVGPGAPARFDVLLTRAGTYPVRILESGERIGAIVVRPEGSAE